MTACRGDEKWEVSDKIESIILPEDVEKKITKNVLKISKVFDKYWEPSTKLRYTIDDWTHRLSETCTSF
jgi:hypothetical protein